MSNPLRRILSLAVVKVMFISIVLTLVAMADAEARRVRVRGYQKKNGTCVPEHYNQEPSLRFIIPILKKDSQLQSWFCIH